MQTVNYGTTHSGLHKIDQESEVMIVGQNPSAKASSTNNTFDRLNSWADNLGLQRFAFMNACHKHGSVKQKDVDLDNLKRGVARARRVIALGNFASEALDRAGVKHFKLPHPSPLNRQINDPQFIQRCLSECRGYIYN